MKTRKMLTTILMSAAASSVAAAYEQGAMGDLSAPKVNLEVYKGLEATLFAKEPMIKAPTQVEVDRHGRVWVMEGRNYRKVRDPKGDRIVILEDTDQDGKADKSSLFYQGKDVNSAMGMTVLGNKVVIANAPDVFVLEDTDNDGKADKKTYLFRGIGGKQHDHSVHTVVEGPDGRYYFAMGDHARGLKDKDGKRIVDKYGNDPYKLPFGKVYRCNPDGSGLEVIAWNFRNPYELSVDAFGGVWQSDNDDGGSPACRINYLLEFGNYGYRGGAPSNGPRSGASSRPEVAHWKQNDGGIIPNLMLTGTGSPTGIMNYSGDLLPQAFQGQILHCDHAQNVVRSYPVTKKGAGYSATMVNLVRGDVSWFRPTDVCAAKDGSVFVADWHDPASGGHRALSTSTGRIYRVAPSGHSYQAAPLSLQSVKEAVQYLDNANSDTQSAAREWLTKNSEQAVTELTQTVKNGEPREAARALWLLVKFDKKHITLGLNHSDEDVRVVAIRAARAVNAPLANILNTLCKDSSAIVRRECAIALKTMEGDVSEIWAELALRHQASDRWSVEALGIAADKRWSSCFSAWLEKVKQWNTPAGRDIVWRARCPEALALYKDAISDKNYRISDTIRFFRAYDSYKNPDDSLVQLLDIDHPDSHAITAYAIKHMKKPSLKNTKLKAAVEKVLEQDKGSSNFVTLVTRFKMKQYSQDLMELALKNSGRPLGSKALTALFSVKGGDLFGQAFDKGDADQRQAIITLVASERNEGAARMLVKRVLNKDVSNSMKIEIVKAVNNASSGARGIMPLVKKGKFPKELEKPVIEILASSPWANVVDWAVAEIVRVNGGVEPLSINKLVVMTGNVERGKTLVRQQCFSCHQIGDQGISFGPSLTTVGDKLGRFAMYDAIINPSAGIEFNYETTIVKLKSGAEYTGFTVNENDSMITLKMIGGIEQKIKKSDILSRKHQKKSMMPDVYGKVMTPQQLADIVSYLTNLKS